MTGITFPFLHEVGQEVEVSWGQVREKRLELLAHERSEGIFALIGPDKGPIH